jgi:non-specific serine/threonine protein kinase/serine/threonine-protein kinase
MTGDTGNPYPATIGPYQVLGPLGEGGMAEVYLAEQSEPVRRRVAVKILKAGMDSKQVVARFESERQALAVLDHPNIAKVFDAGMAENGRPYFVMEYVEGLPITEYCDAGRLSIDRRLSLFVDVCRAVQHAHLKGLVHRDLKPSNILVGDVDGHPQPRIIDFGVAKATEAPLTDSTLETRIGQVVGTPQYMSPEQTGLDGVDVDSRADIYSLGVVLYELLAGVMPLDLSTVRDIALPGVIREKIPPQPSARFTDLSDTRSDVAATRATSPQDLERVLRGDLDWIVMKAIEKDRERRYETANALAADCERFLEHEPVLARPPSRSYRLGRFVRRNRGLVATASVALVALLAGSIATTIGFVRATTAERTALQEAETARQVSEFMVGLFQSSDPAQAQGAEITTREILDRGLTKISSELNDQPLVQATLQTAMGDVYRNLGLFGEAESLFQQSYATRRQLLGLDHPDTLTVQASLGIVSMELGRLDEAIRICEDTLIRRRRVLGDLDASTLWSMQNLASAYRAKGRIEDAERLYREALGVARQVSGQESKLTLWNMSNLGNLYRDTGRLEEAVTLLEEATDIHAQVYGPQHPETLLLMNNLGDIYYDMGRYSEAEELYSAVLDGRERVLGTGNWQTHWSKDRLASVYLAQGRMEEAERLQVAAVAGLRRTFGVRQPQTLASINNLAEIYRAQERYLQAEPLYAEAAQVSSELMPDHFDTGVPIHNLGAIYGLTGRYEEAILQFEKAERIWDPILPPDHLFRMENARLWAEARRALGDEEGAAELEARIEELGGQN